MVYNDLPKKEIKMKILPICNNQYNSGFKSKQTAKQSNNVNFKATLSEPLKQELRTELTSSKAGKIIARLERQLLNVAPNLNIENIKIDAGIADISMKYGESSISYTEEVNTNSKIELILDLMKPAKDGMSELDTLLD